jgi:hypothetical protein
MSAQLDWLNDDDRKRTRTQKNRIRVLMLDGRPRTLAGIVAAIGMGCSEAGASARLRDLRKEGLIVTRTRIVGGNGLHLYSVTKP